MLIDSVCPALCHPVHALLVLASGVLLYAGGRSHADLLTARPDHFNPRYPHCQRNATGHGPSYPCHGAPSPSLLFVTINMLRDTPPCSCPTRAIVLLVCESSLVVTGARPPPCTCPLFPGGAAWERRSAADAATMPAPHPHHHSLLLHCSYSALQCRARD